MDDEQPRNRREPDAAVEAAGSDPGQNIGVYLLDAAAPDERAEFEQTVEASPKVRVEAVQLAPVAAALSKMYDLSPEQAPEAFDARSEPSSTLRERVLASAAEFEPSVREAPVSISTAKPIRPQGRVRGGAPAPAGQLIPMRDRGAWRSPWLAAAAMLIALVGVSLWALGVQNKMNDQTRELHAQSTEVAQIRANSNASAFNIVATSNGPVAGAGTLFYSMKDQKTVLVLNHLPAITDNSVYQLWFIKGASAPAPGLTFQPNRDGSAILSTQAPITSFDVVAFTKEPAGGSAAPTTPILLVGTVNGAAG